jgi:NAD(P)-dependent dehydrogenase (short-subunit alcohol dehydrogenase family)
MDKISLVTGANSGIGKETALGLARLGATVVLACRNREKGEAALNDIRQKSGSSALELMTVDLADLSSVRKMAAGYLDTHAKIDVLINNAGLILTKRSVTVDGFETTFQVNYLSHFLLTHLLLDSLKRSAPSRVINVSSSAHTSGHMHFDDLQCAKGYNAFKSYGQSKLAEVLFTYELARRTSGTKVDVNCLHPGSVASNWGRGSGSWLSAGLRLFSVFETSPQKGAETSIFLASEPRLEGVSGKYFSNKKEIRSSAESYDVDEARRLWDASCELLGIKAMNA